MMQEMQASLPVEETRRWTTLDVQQRMAVSLEKGPTVIASLPPEGLSKEDAARFIRRGRGDD